MVDLFNDNVASGDCTVWQRWTQRGIDPGHNVFSLHPSAIATATATYTATTTATAKTSHRPQFIEHALTPRYAGEHYKYSRAYNLIRTYTANLEREHHHKNSLKSWNGTRAT